MIPVLPAETVTGIPATAVEGDLIAGADLDGVRTAVQRAVRGQSRLDARWMSGSVALLVAVVAAISLSGTRRSRTNAQATKGS